MAESKHFVTAENPSLPDQSDQVKDLMETLQHTIKVGQNQGEILRAEMNQMHATLKSLCSGTNPQPTPSTIALKKTPPVETWYAVDLGHRPRSVEVHFYQTAESEVKGVTGALWKRVSSIEEAWN